MSKLTINDILPGLANVKKAGAGFTARCPLHDDKSNSLSINEDENGAAVVNCFAGCSQVDLWRYFDQFRPRAEARKVKKNIKPVAVYEYVNSAGAVIDTKQRFEPGLKGEKKSFIWVNGTKNRAEPLPLYNLPAIINAPENDLIFLVEGEKDVNTLKSAGYIATSIKDGFTADNMRFLSNRNILIISDNDKPGANLANKAAALVSQVTRRVKIINTADFYENAPEKADITDYINAGGELEKVIQLSKTAQLYKAVLSSNNNKNPIAPYYEKIDHYYINNDNCMVYQNGDNITPLCYGAIAINAEITKFNGLENEIFFDIIAATPGGDLLPRVTISAGEFNSLNWVVKSFGCNLALSPAQSAKQKLLTAITLSGLNCARSRVFTHTGYLFDNEKRPVNYLHAGGDLRNNSAIKTDIDNNLGRYVMSAPGSVDENKQAVNISLSILGAHNSEITYPLLAFIYLSALTPVINTVCGDTGFLLYLQGKTQSGKSTLAALAASHFGKFNAVTPPASFSATANAINEISFILKDCLFWVDDYHPQGNNKDKKRIDSIFQTMARAAGDHATRARLNANSALKVNHPPRCLYLVTGEDEPNINQSGIARIFTINVNYCRKDITTLTAAAAGGVLSRANACYINYVIDNYDDVLSRFEQNYNEALKIAVNTFGACRLANQTALLITSLLLFLGFACDLGAITRDQVNEIYKQGALYIEKAAHNIEKQITDIDPINQYMRAVSALLSSGRKRVINLLTDNFSYNLDEDIIGFSDDVFIYLDSNLAYKAVSDYLLSENNYFSISKTVIQKQLYEKGFVSGSENTPTIVKKINNKSIRVLRFNKEQLLTFGLSE